MIALTLDLFLVLVALRLDLHLAWTVPEFFLPLATDAPPAGKVYRIGWRSPTTSWAGASALEALRAGLRELG
jgi:hypothetical protein